MLEYFFNLVVNWKAADDIAATPVCRFSRAAFHPSGKYQLEGLINFGKNMLLKLFHSTAPFSPSIKGKTPAYRRAQYTLRSPNWRDLSERGPQGIL